MSYFIYARKSRKDADLEALGIDVLERHITTLLELAKTLSLPIGAIYREVVSGDSIDSRPVMSQVMAEVESCMWDGCLVMDVDRLARGDTIDQGRVQRAFFYSNTKIVTPNKTYDPANEYDNEYFEFSLFMSRREYATIKRRMQRGRERSSSDGYYVGKIGTNTMKDNDSQRGLVFDIEYNTAYMSWSNKESQNADVYTMKWSYCTQQCGNYEANMLHAGADINMHFFTLRNVSFEDGSISGTLTFKQPLEVGSDGKLTKWSTATLEFKRGILVSGTWSNG